MTDDELWTYEESLWTGDADHYRESIDAHCVMVLPEEPFAMSGRQAIEAVAATPRWASAELSQRKPLAARRRPDRHLLPRPCDR